MTRHHKNADAGISAKARCQHDGCTNADGISCWLPETPLDAPPDEYYCEAHITDAGYCWGCGLFWAGVESFDFNPTGLCENCQDAADREQEIWYDTISDNGHAQYWEWEDDASWAWEDYEAIP